MTIFKRIIKVDPTEMVLLSKNLKGSAEAALELSKERRTFQTREQPDRGPKWEGNSSKDSKNVSVAGVTSDRTKMVDEL